MNTILKGLYHMTRGTVKNIHRRIMNKPPPFHVIGDINSTTVTKFRSFLKQYKTCNRIQFIIESAGGDFLQTHEFVRLMHESQIEFEAHIPNISISGATTIALASHKIYLHPFATFGTIDPILTYSNHSFTVPAMSADNDLPLSICKPIRNTMNYNRRFIRALNHEINPKTADLLWEEFCSGKYEHGMTLHSKDLKYLLRSQLIITKNTLTPEMLIISLHELKGLFLFLCMFGVGWVIQPLIKQINGDNDIHKKPTKICCQ